VLQADDLRRYFCNQSKMQKLQEAQHCLSSYHSVLLGLDMRRRNSCYPKMLQGVERCLRAHQRLLSRFDLPQSQVQALDATRELGHCIDASIQLFFSHHPCYSEVGNF
jgi:hypothetical protein